MWTRLARENEMRVFTLGTDSPVEVCVTSGPDTLRSNRYWTNREEINIVKTFHGSDHFLNFTIHPSFEGAVIPSYRFENLTLCSRNSVSCAWWNLNSRSGVFTANSITQFLLCLTVFPSFQRRRLYTFSQVPAWWKSIRIHPFTFSMLGLALRRAGRCV